MFNLMQSPSGLVIFGNLAVCYEHQTTFNNLVVALNHLN